MKIARDLLVSFILSLGALCAFLLSQPIEAKRRVVMVPGAFHHGYYAGPLAGETSPTVTLAIPHVVERVNAHGARITPDDLTGKAYMLFRDQAGFGRAVVSNHVARDGFLFVPVHCTQEPATIWLRTYAGDGPSTIPTGDSFIKVFDNVVVGECK